MQNVSQRPLISILTLFLASCQTQPLPTATSAGVVLPAGTEERTIAPPPTTTTEQVSTATSSEQRAAPSSTAEFQRPQGHEPGWLNHGTEDPLPPIDFSSEGDTLATGHRDGRVLLWDISTGRQLQALDRPVSAPSLGEITALAFSPDGALIAAAKPGQGSIDLWQVPTGEFEQALEAGQGVIEIAFSPDGQRLASAIGRGQRPQVIVWDTESWTQLATLQDVGPTVAFTQDSSTVVTQSGASLAASDRSTDPESAIVLWDFASGQKWQAIRLDGFIVSIDYDAARNLVAANLLPVMSEGKDPTPRTLLLDATSGATLHSLEPPLEESAPPPTGPDLLALSPDGSLLAVGYQPNRIDLWQAASGEHLLTLRGPADWLRYPLFSPDGSLLAASSSDGRILFWDVAALRANE
jgi:WD40 repeat protein